MFRILIAEDNPGDVLLFREALRGCNLSFEIVVAEDGQRAMALLEDLGKAGPQRGTDLIVLDVNLPKHCGDEILENIRRDPSWAEIPVIMLTASASPDDQARAKQLGANLYIQKSANLDDLFEIGRAVEALLKHKGGSRPDVSSA
ncbi:MAG TPA: response regulator [Bryobacteraceae bacterium]|nr:response regulator [Bryobacteraceae bacterium]